MRDRKLTQIINKLPNRCKAKLNSFIKKTEKKKGISLEIIGFREIDYGLVWQYYFKTIYGIISLLFSDNGNIELEFIDN